MKRIFTIFTFFLLLSIGACSATQEIAKTTNEVRNLAISSEAHADALLSSPNLDPLDLAHAGSIKSEQKQIQAKADLVATKIPKVKDNVPYWLTVVKWVAGAVVLVVGLFAAWYTGLLNLVAGFLRTLGLLIPHPVAARASLDAKAIVQGTACAVHREAIAASRATSKAYDSAFARAKKSEEAKQ